MSDINGSPSASSEGGSLLSANAETPVRRYALSIGRDFLSPDVSVKHETAARVVAFLQKFTVIPMTVAEYAALSKLSTEKTDIGRDAARRKGALKKESGFFIGGDGGGSKKSADWQYSSLATLDLDALTPGSAAASIEALRAFGAHTVIYCTASHTKEKPRLRAVVFLAADVLPAQYRSLIDWFAGRLPVGAVSSESHKVVQIMYRAQRCSDGEELFIELPGAPLDVTPILSQVAPPSVERKSKLTPAWDKPGIVGAIGRRYMGDLGAAIVELGHESIPYTRSPRGPMCGLGENRYTRDGATGTDGALWHENDGHMFSHHGASDPGAEQECTIFDIVRLTLFGDPRNPSTYLDKDVPNDTPPHRRPSHAACEQWFYERLTGLWSSLVHDRAELEFDIVAAPAELPPEVRVSRFRPVPVAEFTGGAEPEWLIESVIPQSELAVIYGESGSGKSFFVSDLCLSIVRGLPWRDKVVKQGCAVYVCAESPGGFRGRFKAYAYKHGIQLRDLNGLFVIGSAPNLLAAEDVTELLDQLKALGPLAIVVVDTLARATPGANENSGEDMGLALKHCQRIHRVTGAVVALVHHSGKDATKGARGWSGIRAAADVEIEITRNGNARAAEVTKQRDGEDGARYGFELLPVVYGADAKGNELSSLVVEPKLTSTVFEGRRPRGANENAVYDALTELGGSAASGAVIAKAITKLVTDPEKEDRRRDNARRALQSLVIAGLLKLENERVSMTRAQPVDATEFETKIEKEDLSWMELN